MKHLSAVAAAFSVIFVSGIATTAHAQSSAATTGCQSSTSGMSALGRIANRENCLNEQAQKYRSGTAAEREAQEKKLASLKEKYTNASASDKARLQRKIDKAQGRLTNLEQTPSNTVSKFRDSATGQRDQMNGIVNKSRSDLGNFLKGG
ncbi:hypothetical protein [Brytella acorum]|uniref:Uncharacterized protein n=2 Tax=Brytella acorum TaxID=2959299 RepID=A0AA35XXH2_9PROT|nr:hypothetical protein [Brytella acorum]CAI9120292.1 hypothetical protein LMG32879_001124 [Brytella acorum]